MARYRYVVADVFTDTPLTGNQLAVFTDARDLPEARLQELAREMNFSESTFVIPHRKGSPRVRIFTPQREIPMAGHPTVGTTWVLAVRRELTPNRNTNEATVKLGIGDVVVTVEGTPGQPRFVWMAHRAAEFGPRRSDRQRVARALGIQSSDLRSGLPIEPVSTGVPFLFVPLRSREAVDRCLSDKKALAGLFPDKASMLGVYVFTPGGNPSRPEAYVRMFAPHTDGIVEDPATGGASAPLGAYLLRHRVIEPRSRTRLLVRQGLAMGRPSEIHVEIRHAAGQEPAIRIGGKCAIVGSGAMTV